MSLQALATQKPKRTHARPHTHTRTSTRTHAHTHSHSPSNAALLHLLPSFAWAILTMLVDPHHLEGTKHELVAPVDVEAIEPREHQCAAEIQQVPDLPIRTCNLPGAPRECVSQCLSPQPNTSDLFQMHASTADTGVCEGLASTESCDQKMYEYGHPTITRITVNTSTSTKPFTTKSVVPFFPYSSRNQRLLRNMVESSQSMPISPKKWNYPRPTPSVLPV